MPPIKAPFMQPFACKADGNAKTQMAVKIPTNGFMLASWCGGCPRACFIDAGSLGL